MEAIHDLDVLTDSMATLGFRLTHAKSGSMDSGFVEFSDGKKKVAVLKDRSQWMLDGDQSELEPLGLWRAFSATSDFRDVLIAYAQKKKA